MEEKMRADAARIKEEVINLKDQLIQKIENLYRQGYVIDYEWLAKHYENIAFVDGECQCPSTGLPYLCEDENGIGISFWEYDREYFGEMAYTSVLPDYISPKFFQNKKNDEENFVDPLENVCIEHLCAILFRMFKP